MLGHAGESVHGIVAEPRTQPLDELRQVPAGFAPVMRKQLDRIGLQVDERAAQQAHVAHGLRQHELRKTLAQQLRHVPRLRTDRLHETQPHARDRGSTMTQLHFDRLHATATLAQELAQFFEQGGERQAEPCGIGDFGFEVAPRGKAFACGIRRARLLHTTRGAIERGKQLLAEAAREAIARQAQAVAHGAHAHGAERLDAAFGPPGAIERQRRKPRSQFVPVAYEHGSRAERTRAREPQRCQRRRRDRKASRRARGIGEFLLQSQAQLPGAAKQPQAATHLEQYAVGRLEADPRRESHAALRHRLEQLAFAPCIARQRMQARHECERCVDRHSLAHACGVHGFCAGAHDLAVALEVDDGDRRTTRQGKRHVAQRIEQQ